MNNISSTFFLAFGWFATMKREIYIYAEKFEVSLSLKFADGGGKV